MVVLLILSLLLWVLYFVLMRRINFVSVAFHAPSSIYFWRNCFGSGGDQVQNGGDGAQPGTWTPAEAAASTFFRHHKQWQLLFVLSLFTAFVFVLAALCLNDWFVYPCSDSSSVHHFDLWRFSAQCALDPATADSAEVAALVLANAFALVMLFLALIMLFTALRVVRDTFTQWRALVPRLGGGGAEEQTKLQLVSLQAAHRIFRATVCCFCGVLAVQFVVLPAQLGSAGFAAATSGPSLVLGWCAVILLVLCSLWVEMQLSYSIQPLYELMQPYPHLVRGLHPEAPLPVVVDAIVLEYGEQQQEGIPSVAFSPALPQPSYSPAAFVGAPHSLARTSQTDAADTDLDANSPPPPPYNHHEQPTLQQRAGNA
jgi:hypothetical protein